MFADIPLGIAVETLAPASSAVLAAAKAGDHAARLQELLAAGKDAGYGIVQLDGTKAGLRARELDRSARRDVASMLRRAEVGFAGLDMWVPSEHFAKGETVDRAVSAVVEAAELAADLWKLSGLLGGVQDVGGVGGRPSVCVSLAVSEAKEGAGVVAAIAAAADRFGVAVADFGEGAIERLRGVKAGAEEKHAAGVKGEAVAATKIPVGNDDVIGLGVDPAALMLAGLDVSAAVLGAGRHVAAARLTDVAKTPDRRRVAAGSGGLDLLSYRVALTTAGFAGTVIVDLSGVARVKDATKEVVERWGESMLG